MSLDVFNPPLRSLSPASFGARRAHLLREIELEQPTRFTGRPIRRSTIALAFVIAGLLAATAYAIVQEVIVGSPAPSSVMHAEQLRNEVQGEIIPQAGANPGIEIAKTIAAAAITTPPGPAYLWVAPDTHSGPCVYLQIVALDLPEGLPYLVGGCTGETGVWARIVLERVHGQLLGWLEGHAAIPGARTLKIAFTDGTTHTYPITHNFALGVVSPDVGIASTMALTGAGHVLTTQRVPSPSISQMHGVAILRTIGTHWLLIEKGESDRDCKQLAVGGRSPVVIFGCGMVRLSATSLNVGPDQIGAAPNKLLLLWGPVGTDVHSLELTFQDGTHVLIPIHQGYILYQINPRNYASGHRPTKLLARNSAGRIVRVQTFGFRP